MKPIKNPQFTIADVKKRYSPSYNVVFPLVQSRVKEFMNVGYSEHFITYPSTKSQIRLVDKLASKIMEITNKRRFEIRNFLDIACGHGGAAIYMAKKYGINVTGLDFSRYNLDIAKSYIKESGVEELVKLMVGDALDMPFKNRSFDGCWVIESPHILKKEKLAKNVNRVLKTGGIFGFTDIFANVKNIKKSKANLKTYQDFMYYWDIPYLETFDGWRKILHENNFNIVYLEDISKYNIHHGKNLCKLGLLFLKLMKSKLLNPFTKKYNIDWQFSFDFIKNLQATLENDLVRYGMICAIKV